MTKRRIGILAALMLIIAACGGGDATDTTAAGDEATTTAAAGDTEATDGETTDTEPSGDSGDDLGEPEVDTITVATASHDAGSNGPFIVGTGQGFFEEEGLDVQVAVVDDPRPALAGGSAQVAVLEVPFTAQAITEGIDLAAISGFRCVEPYMISVQEDITSVEQLDGENVFLNGVPGEPVVDFRLELLKEAGWDLSTVDVNYVNLQGDNESWVAQWTEGAIAMTIHYREDTPVLAEHGVNTIINELIQWPNEILVAPRSFVEENPNAVAHFLRGMLKSIDWYLDLGNEAEFLEMANAQDYPSEQAALDYGSGPYLFCNNLYVNSDEVARQLEVQEVEGAPAFEEYAMLEPLMSAQEAMGLDNEPPPPLDPELGMAEE